MLYSYSIPVLTRVVVLVSIFVLTKPIFCFNMVSSDEIVYVNCIHKGCECKRMFLQPESAELPDYVCIKHRRLFEDDMKFNI